MMTDDRLEFWVTTEVQSLNKFVGKTSAWPWKKYKKEWEDSIGVLIPIVDVRPVKAYTTIISHRTRLLDKENLYGGSKPIRDLLQKPKGWIYNDSPKWGDLTVWQNRVKSKDEIKTEVRVWLDLEGE